MNYRQVYKEAYKNMEYNSRLDPEEQLRYDRAQRKFYNWMSRAAEDFLKQNPDAFLETTIGVCFKMAIDLAKELGMPIRDIKRLFNVNLKTKRGIVANVVLGIIGRKIYDPFKEQETV